MQREELLDHLAPIDRAAYDAALDWWIDGEVAVMNNEYIALRSIKRQGIQRKKTFLDRRSRRDFFNHLSL